MLIQRVGLSGVVLGLSLVALGCDDGSQLGGDHSLRSSPLWELPEDEPLGEWSLGEGFELPLRPLGGFDANPRADVFARDVVNDAVFRFPPQPAASLAGDAECSVSTDWAALLVDPMEALQDGDPKANLEALSALQFQLQCLDEASVRVLDVAVGVMLHRAAELPEDQGDTLVAGMWNAGLLIADQLMHTGHSWVVSSAELNQDEIRISLERSAWQTVWAFNRRTDSMVRLPPRMCLGGTCAGTATSMLEAFEDPRRLGSGFCGLEALAASGMRCPQAVQCSPRAEDARLEGAAEFAQMAFGADVFAPNPDVLSGFVPGRESLSPNPFPRSPGLSQFGHGAGEARDVLCQGGMNPGQAGSAHPPFADTFECLLQQNREREAALGCEMGMEAPDFVSVAVHSVRDPRCGLGGDDAGTPPPPKPAEEPAERKDPKDLTPAQKAALNKAIKSANDTLKRVRDNAKALTAFTNKINTVIKTLNENPGQFPGLAKIAPVTEAQVKTALGKGADAPVAEIIPESEGSLGEAADGKIAVGEELLSGSPANDAEAHNTILEEKLHITLDALKVPGGPNHGDYHHAIMVLTGVPMNTTGAHDTLEPGAAGPCSSAAEKAMQEHIECQMQAVEEALARAGLGRPGLIPPWEDPRTQKWDQDSAPVDPIECLDLGGTQLPQTDPACARVLCVDEIGCECAGYESGGVGSLPPFGGQDCLLTMCAPDQELDPVTCECRGFGEPVPGDGLGPDPFGGGFPTWP